MTCRKLVQFLDAYVERSLPPETRIVFEQHLAECVDCRAYLDSYQRTIAAARAAISDRHAPAALSPIPEQLVSAILTARRADLQDVRPPDTH